MEDGEDLKRTDEEASLLRRRKSSSLTVLYGLISPISIIPVIHYPTPCLNFTRFIAAR